MSESEDFLQYELLVEEALRGVMRKALDLVAKHGLEGDHYFHITFRTDHPGVDIPAHLHREYPEEMPVILQNAFWDLEVGEIGFSVSLSFNRVQQRMTIPFDAITIFQDPPANFRLHFQAGEEEEDGSEAGADSDAVPAAEATTVPVADAVSMDNGDKVVTLDAFRNK
jgi:hypothetical protein